VDAERHTADLDGPAALAERARPKLIATGTGDPRDVAAETTALRPLRHRRVHPRRTGQLAFRP
jgi:hypothetical protein